MKCKISKTGNVGPVLKNMKMKNVAKFLFVFCSRFPHILHVCVRVRVPVRAYVLSRNSCKSFFSLTNSEDEALVTGMVRCVLDLRVCLVCLHTQIHANAFYLKN